MSTIYLFNENRRMDKDNGIIFREVRISYDGPRTFTFARDVRFDEGDILANGNKVTVVSDGYTLFSGWLLDHDPSLTSDNEFIEYRAVGPRAKLGGITHTRNGSANVIYNAENKRDESTSGWTYKQIFEDVISSIPKEYVATTSGTHLLTDVAPEIRFAGMSIDDCLRYIVEKAGKFGFYITPSRQLRVVDLSSTTAKNVYVAEIGQPIDSHTEYDVAEANLNWSISGCKTTCLIEGARERTETYVNLVPNWNRDLEQHWTWYASEIPQNVVDSMYSGDNLSAYKAMQKVFRQYKISGVSLNRIWNRLISDDNRRPYTEFLADNGTDWIYAQGVIDLMTGIVNFPFPIYKKRTKHEGTPSETITREARDGRLYCVVEGTPLKVTVGPTGTAYSKGVKSELYILDESLVKENVAREGYETARDDTSNMQTMANSLLDAVKDETVTGTVSIDGLDYGWSLDNGVNLRNTRKATWSTLDATLLGISYRFEFPEQTVLQLSNSHYLGAAPGYAELKWRLMVGKRIRELEEDVNELTFLTGSAVGGGETSTVTVRSAERSYDADAPSERWSQPSGGQTRTADEIKELIQDAMDDNYFTIQKHTHIGDSQGGAAYAESGAALL